MPFPVHKKWRYPAGIGMFLAIIAPRNAGIVVDSPAMLVQLSNLGTPSALFAALGFFAMVAMDRLRVLGAILISIITATILSTFIDLSTYSGIVSAPPSLSPTFMQLDITAAFELGLISLVFVFLFVDLFDTAGSLTGVAHRAGLLDEHGRLPRLRSALLAESLATVACAALGRSTTTSYIEGAPGIRAGGRTSLTPFVVAVLSLGCLYFTLLAGSVPAYATVPALLFVVCMMARSLSEINWDDVNDYVPAVVTALAMPLTFSIATGIGIGLLPMPRSKY